jgi:hypothetical protein
LSVLVSFFLFVFVFFVVFLLNFFLYRCSSHILLTLFLYILIRFHFVIFGLKILFHLFFMFFILVIFLMFFSEFVVNSVDLRRQRGRLCYIMYIHLTFCEFSELVNLLWILLILLIWGGALSSSAVYCLDYQTDLPPLKKRGRPNGSKNKTKEAKEEVDNLSTDTCQVIWPTESGGKICPMSRSYCMYKEGPFYGSHHPWSQKPRVLGLPFPDNNQGNWLVYHSTYNLKLLIDWDRLYLCTSYFYNSSNKYFVQWPLVHEHLQDKAFWHTQYLWPFMVMGPP